LFDLWVHGPEGTLTDVRPPPDAEALAAHLVRTGVMAAHQRHAAWDGLRASAEDWQGALEWARLFQRDPDDAMRRLHADAELLSLARRHGWDQVSALDPGRRWADVLWEELQDLVPGDARRERLLDSLPPPLLLRVVAASEGRIKPTWVGGSP